MGIQNLLPKLNNASKRVTFAQLSGCIVAVDASMLLHRGAYGCALDLCCGNDTDSYVKYVIKWLETLTSHGILPILVFDGIPLPAKKEENNKRYRERAAAIAKDKALLQENKRQEANLQFQKGVSVTFKMVTAVIKAVQQLEYHYIVAPYEADAHMARNGIVDIVMTEDSDLLVYGAPKELFKARLEDSGGLLIEQEKLHFCFDFTWTFDRFVWLCILLGCDYLESIRNVGFVSATRS